MLLHVYDERAVEKRVGGGQRQGRALEFGFGQSRHGREADIANFAAVKNHRVRETLNALEHGLLIRGQSATALRAQHRQFLRELFRLQIKHPGVIRWHLFHRGAEIRVGIEGRRFRSTVYSIEQCLQIFHRCRRQKLMSGNGRGEGELPAAEDVDVMFLVIDRAALCTGRLGQQPRFPAFDHAFRLFFLAAKFESADQTERVEIVRCEKAIAYSKRSRIVPGFFHGAFFRQPRFRFLQKVLHRRLAIQLIKISAVPGVSVLLRVWHVDEEGGIGREQVRNCARHGRRMLSDNVVGR